MSRTLCHRHTHLFLCYLCLLSLRHFYVVSYIEVELNSWFKGTVYTRSVNHSLVFESVFNICIHTYTAILFCPFVQVDMCGIIWDGRFCGEYKNVGLDRSIDYFLGISTEWISLIQMLTTIRNLEIYLKFLNFQSKWMRRELSKSRNFIDR